MHDAVAVACPDYAAEIATLLCAHETAPDVPDEAIPEAVADLIAETFSEPEAEEATNGDSEEADHGDAEDTAGVDADPVAVAEERLNNIKALLLRAKQQLMNLESDREALEQRPIVDEWAFYDNSGPIPRLLGEGVN